MAVLSTRLRAPHSEGTLLGETLSCGRLEIPNHFKQGAGHFHPALGPPDHITGPAYVVTGATIAEESSIYAFSGNSMTAANH